MYKIKSNDNDMEKLISTYKDAFSKYPKLMGSFPDKSDRLNALEATLRFYCAYDICYGRGLSSDCNINDAILFIHSDEMAYTQQRYEKANCESEKYKEIMRKLSQQQQAKRIEVFDEIDRMESELKIPFPHLYVDFLGVKEKFQGQGRGKKLVKKVIEIAYKEKLPIMLFTNTPEDVSFYEKLGFRQIGNTQSKRYKFHNVYLVKDYII